MKTEIIITDLTNMHAGRICVAGVNPQKQTIRPLFHGRHVFLDWCWQRDQIIKPFTKIELDLLSNTSKPPHTEDWLADEQHLKITGEVDRRYRQNYLQSILDDDVQSIFGTPIHHQEGYFVDLGTGNRSLGTVKANNLSHFSNKMLEGKRDYRVTFIDKSNHWYRLKIVDLSFQAYVDHLRETQPDPEEVSKYVNSIFKQTCTYLRVGLARGWGNYPKRCYLQITGVFTFPDYLCGKCFADFIQTSP